MDKKIPRTLFINIFLTTIVLLSACVTTHDKQTLTLLDAGKKNFMLKQYAVAHKQLWIPAKKGYASAQYALGYMYYYGKGVPENIYAAHYWIRKSALQNYQPAKQALELMDKPIWSGPILN